MSADLPEPVSQDSTNSSATPDVAPLKPAPPRRKILIGTQRPGVLDAMRAEVAKAEKQAQQAKSVVAETKPAPVAQAQAEVASAPKTEVVPEQKPEVKAEPVAKVKPAPEKEPVQPKVVAPPVAQSVQATSKEAKKLEDKKAEYKKADYKPTDDNLSDKSDKKEDDKKEGDKDDDRRDSRGKKRQPKVDTLAQIVANTPHGKVSTIPVPTSRTPMTPELVAEYEAALGDLAEINGLNTVMNNTPVGKLGVTYEQDDKIEAIVARITREDVILSLDNVNQGIASLRQFTEVPEVGAKVKVNVVRYNESEGLYEVTLPNVAAIIGDWSEVQEGMVVDVAITGQNTGGLECEVAHIRAFMPAGQVSIYHRDNFDDLINTHMMAVVLEAKPEKRNLVVSHKAFEFRQRESEKKEFLAKMEVGETYDAVVRKIMPFGCFVDLGHGVEGLVHISRLAWGHVENPNEVVKEGDMIQVKYLKTDDKGKLSFSRKETMPSPWDLAPAKYAINTVCTAKIVKIETFGAFCELEPGVEGLLHISELSHQRVGHVSDVVKPGQEVQVQIVAFDAMERKIGLSMKALVAAPVKEEKEDEEKKKEKEIIEVGTPLPKKFRNLKTDNLKGGAGTQKSSKYATDFSSLLGKFGE